MSRLVLDYSNWNRAGLPSPSTRGQQRVMGRRRRRRRRHRTPGPMTKNHKGNIRFQPDVMCCSQTPPLFPEPARRRTKKESAGPTRTGRGARTFLRSEVREQQNVSGSATLLKTKPGSCGSRTPGSGLGRPGGGLLGLFSHLLGSNNYSREIPFGKVGSRG